MQLNFDVFDRNITGDAESLNNTVAAPLKVDRQATILVRLLKQGVAMELKTGELLSLIIKDESAYEGPVLQIVEMEPTDLVPHLGQYKKVFSMVTEEVVELMGLDGTPGNESRAKRVMAALIYTPDGGEPVESMEFYLDLYPTILQDDDSIPVLVPGREEFLSARAVRYDIAQSLDAGEKTQALGNIGGAPLASPAFTGTPTAPTAAPGTSTTQIANTEFVALAVADLVASSPAALDTLNELATALANDPNFATTMTNALAGKVPTSRNVNTSGLASGGGSLAADKTIDVPIASQAQAEAGTNNATAMTPLRVAQAIAALASGGGGGQPETWAYVDPVNGHDTTGDGSATSPWATIQKAVVTEGKDFIILAAGNAGALNLPQSARNLCVLGAGREESTIAGITVADGGSLNIQDIGMYSVNITGILCVGSEAFPDGGDLTMTGIWSVNDSCGSLGASRTTPNTSGGNGGIVRAYHCRLINLSSNGGNGSEGVSGEPGDPGGNGGNGGSVEAEYCFISGQFEAVAGPGGSDAGAGVGSPGSNGSLYARFCEIGSIGDGSQNVHASIVSSTWTD
jgi:hypothetical protein